MPQPTLEEITSNGSGIKPVEKTQLDRIEEKLDRIILVVEAVDTFIKKVEPEITPLIEGIMASPLLKMIPGMRKKDR